jgi:lysophospholipase L1-like esterase
MNKKQPDTIKKPIIWNCLGDSITDIGYTSKHYFEYIQDRAQIYEIRNYGISGTRIAGTESDAMCNRYAEMQDADLVTVFGGVNDWGQENPVPLGTENDTDYTTFYGALKKLCKGLQDKYPSSIIIFVAPLGCAGFNEFAVNNNDFGLSVRDYVDAMSHVCNSYDFPVIDMYRDHGFSPYKADQNKKYFFDGLHLNDEGHLLISYVMEEAILKKLKS